MPYFERTTTKAILREHGRGLPEYDDANESDVFAFSDVDELVKIGVPLLALFGELASTLGRSRRRVHPLLAITEH